MNPLYLLGGAAGLVAVSVGVGWYTGASNARASEQRKQGEVLIASNRVWIARLDSIKTVAEGAQKRATSSAAEAELLRRQRRSVPAPPPDASAEARAAYWEGQAVSAENEADKLRVSYEEEKKATAALRLTVDSTKGVLEATSHALGKSLDREQGKRKLLGFIPRPPKILAAAVGCIAGAVVARKDPTIGCGLGGMTAVVVLPTR